MRYTWPSWLSVALGLVALALAAYVLHADADAAVPFAALFLGAAVLLAGGLHGLQTSWSANCCCDYAYGCDCNHCGQCRGGDCCGQCECVEPPNGHLHGDDHGHSH